MLLTRSPVYLFSEENVLLDLHVLSTPPAFVLSQDQTLHCMSLMYLLCRVLVLIDVTDPRIPNYQISFIEDITSNKARKLILIILPVSISYYVIFNIFYILTEIIISSKNMLRIPEHSGTFVRRIGRWSKYPK